MASNVRISKKRKAVSFYYNLDVDEADCSPSNSPECEEYVSCETEIKQTKTEVSNEKLSLVEESSSIKIGISKSDDLRCMDMDVADSPQQSPEPESKPFLSIIFNDNEFAALFKAQIIYFIRNLVNFELNEQCDNNVNSTTVHLWEYSNCENDRTVVDAKEKEVDLFVVDTTPSKTCEAFPRYNPNNCNVIEDNDSSKGGRNETMMRSANVCFNCDGNHSLKDCTETKDHRRIAIARNKFMNNSQSKNVRYHVDEQNDKFKHLIAGKMSDKLRKALDLRRNELPEYIYRMRLCGYPPGWLQEAIEAPPLELFDFHGCAVDCNNDKKSIDTSKIIEYPGFNVPLEKGYKDEYKYYKCPPYSDKLSKETMITYLDNLVKNDVQNKSEPCATTTQSKSEESDSNSQESESLDTHRSRSPSLTDLEQQKKKLLEELAQGSCQNSPMPAEDNSTDKQISTPTPVTTTADDVLESPSVVSSVYGTPILKTASPFSQLPDRDKWSKDISQVINFENLPNSTGKYEQMTKVINKVRTTVAGGKNKS